MSCCKIMEICAPCACDFVGLSDVLPVLESDERVEVRPVALLPSCDLCAPCTETETEIDKETDNGA